MPVTITSSSAPYITPSDLLNWRDWRQLADWLSITDARGSQSAFTSSTVAIEHCNAAGGLLEAALVKGNRYLVVDLQQLQAAAPNQCWSMVKRMLCWLAIDSMSRFKARTPTDEQEIDRANALLEQLANGERILSFQESQDAGQIDNTRFGSRHHEPSHEAQRMFGFRGDRRRIGDRE